VASSLGFLLAIFLAGCASTRIALKEQFGYAKREQLVDRVQEARDDQEEAKQQFRSALEEFIAVTDAEPTDLEAIYSRLNKEYDRCENKADDVHDRITEVEQVATALFKEWNAELDQYSDDDLRRSSEQQLERTRMRYDLLVEKMKQAEESMAPVLTAFKDQVLFLKHNLNAQAIASLQRNVTELQADVSHLIVEMEMSIAEADVFIKQMQHGETQEW
jgi:hypothetical protein